VGIEGLIAVVPPDEPFPEVIPHGCLQLSQSRLAVGQGLAPGAAVHRLDLLHVAVRSGLRPTLRRRPYSSYLPSQTNSVLITQALPISCRHIANILPINYNPPESGFLATNGKKAFG
jgi:hypothetical protein